MQEQMNIRVIAHFLFWYSFLVLLKKLLHDYLTCTYSSVDAFAIFFGIDASTNVSAFPPSFLK